MRCGGPMMLSSSATGCRNGADTRRCWRRTWRSPISALDLIGQARALYAYAAKVEGEGNDEDKYAYLRDAHQYRNVLLAEQPNGDFATTLPGNCSIRPSPTPTGAP